MASSYTGLGTELMTTGENAGTWGSTTNTNLQILEQISGGYTAQSIAGSAQTTTLSVSDGSTGATLAHRIIEFTGTITGNQVVTVPLDVQTFYIMKNNTSGAYTVQFKYATGSGSSVTWAATDKGTKLIYATADDGTNPNMVDSNIGGVGSYDLDGNELTLDADSDTSITASTDDQIDFEISGADDFTMTANAFNVLTGSHVTFADSANAKFGTGNDMLLYHDGSNSYITNAVGALKIATETSGIAVTIGHTTSETTIADNLTVTGTLTGTLATAAQGSVTSLGTLTTLTVDNVIINGTTIGHTSDTDLLTLASAGLTLLGTLTVGVDDTGHDVKLFGATSGSYALWDESADSLLLTDSTPLKIGDAQDLTLYHDGTNSYITNAVGALKIATETSGIAVTIGHTTSETTVADNLTVTGDFAAGNFKFGGANFSNSLLVGHSTTGTLDAAEDNVGVGNAALDALTTGDKNVAVGSGAGGANETGFEAVYVGYQAGVNATSTYNTAVGSTAMQSMTSGNKNTAVGRRALFYCTTAGFNTAIGYEAGKAIGQSGASGQYNIALGYQSGDNITSGSGNVIIGKADVSSATGDDQLSISDGEDGSVAWITGDSSGNLTFPADATLGDDLYLDSDSSVIHFGDDGDVTVTHDPDDGLILKSAATADNNPFLLTIQTGETDIAADDIIGTINFQAPDEAQGTDAILVAAGIEAVSEGDFSSSNNATKLSFKTGASEAAAEKVAISSAGNLSLTASNTELRFYEGSNYVGFEAPALSADQIWVLPSADGSANQVLKTDGSGALGWATTSSAADDISTGDAAVTVATSSGNITIDAQAGDADIIFKGTDSSTDITALTLDMSDVGTAIFNNDIFLDSDSCVLKFGDDGDTTLTHTDGTGLTLNSTNKLTFGDAATYINQSSDGVMTVAGEATIDLTASTAVLVSNDLKLDSDSAVIGFGADNDTTLTHTDGTGLTLNSTNKLCFNDASQFVQGSSATVLSLGATDEIDLTATAIDINGTCDISGTFSLAGTNITTTAAEINKLDGGTSATSTTVADADRVILNDNGTIVQVAMTDIKTYIGGGTSWQAVKTGNYTASAGQGVFVNTTSAAITVTLPAGTIGDEVSIIDYAGTADSNNITIAADGSEKIHGSTDDLTVATERAAFTLVFTDSTQGWLLKDK